MWVDQNIHQCDRNSLWLPFPLTYGSPAETFSLRGLPTHKRSQQMKKWWKTKPSVGFSNEKQLKLCKFSGGEGTKPAN